jgi:hypothetical protein
MKFVNFLLCGIFILKICGFGFFTVKSSLNGLTYQKNILDYGFFVASFAFSFVLYDLEMSHSIDMNIKSVILNIGTVFLFRVAMISVIITKVANMIGSREAFTIFQDFERINKKVCS